MTGFVRTRIAAVHWPSPLMDGCTGGEISLGRFGIVVVLLEVVVETSMATGVVEVVDVVVVAESVAGTDGHDCVATVGTRCAGAVLPSMVVVDATGLIDRFDVVVVDGSIFSTTGIVVVGTGSVSNVTSANESAGATAGASLWVHASS